MRCLSVLALVLALAAAARLVEGAGECGATPADQMALKLAPCLTAAKDPEASPSKSCCAAVVDIWGHSTECLCAVLLSNTLKRFGVKVEVAITIPKRCNIANRPIGYKCGDYTLPSLQD
ncbi:non-specific lipid transfer protein GPI-anchored 1 [Brachypodium distachyon]|uniref:Bifunctional inhibitor/plant lipid transfer protein/seed storage helical domain-containing protein n=1 Tax=Brachypodium distachyon TaxID=15368 RepID=I1IXK8_BRADI|nr:non-specific lipid transfer protein GPI-anchored 1 [Brachypodium distachyon]KQJ82550.1 hypothetical protein BRADI_5g09617v3 [Brachypodium distachyon]|eukprot:XP_003579714.1 non-specific lipid transfer protein GPI-anchored 1 [Brachypodium distachyon]